MRWCVWLLSPLLGPQLLQATPFAVPKWPHPEGTATTWQMATQRLREVVCSRTAAQLAEPGRVAVSRSWRETSLGSCDSRGHPGASLHQLLPPVQPCQSGPVILQTRIWSLECFKMASRRVRGVPTHRGDECRRCGDARDPALPLAHPVPWRPRSSVALGRLLAARRPGVGVLDLLTQAAAWWLSCAKGSQGRK